MANPYVTSGVPGTFKLTGSGAKEGTSRKNAVNQALQIDSGLFSGTVAWGGQPIVESVSTELTGNVITLASTIASITGWSTFDGANHPVMDQGTIGLYQDDMTINFYRKGAGTLLWVKIDDDLVESVIGGSVTQNLGYDFTNYKIAAYVSGTALPVRIEAVSVAGTSTINTLVSYNATTGNAEWSTEGCANTAAGSPVYDSSLALIRV